jgi:Mlc titration factor MtfA (ptsG expression regulator)
MILGIRKGPRRERVRARSFPRTWRAVLDRNVPIVRRLAAADQRELLGHTAVLLDEKHFEGCGGLELTDEIRVTIAAQACLLLLHRDADYFPELTSILVYPSGYRAHEVRHVGGHIWQEGAEDRSGHTGERLRAIVLAWDAVLHGAADPADGQNIVLHEFAHQLDFENRTADGTPALDTRSEYSEWKRVMTAELGILREALQRGSSTVLDTYGATDPAEFFAVSTEAFFERPRALRASRPALYTALRRFYRHDPVTYSAEPPWAG